jgi:hypothetical protein
MLWNEPNNLSHRDFEIDMEWRMFAAMTRYASQAIAAEAPGLPRVFGGMSRPSIRISSLAMLLLCDPPVTQLIENSSVAH